MWFCAKNLDLQCQQWLNDFGSNSALGLMIPECFACGVDGLPAASSTSASIFSVRRQKRASTPTTDDSSLSRGIGSSQSHWLTSQCSFKIDFPTSGTRRVMNTLGRFMARLLWCKEKRRLFLHTESVVLVEVASRRENLLIRPCGRVISQSVHESSPYKSWM